MRSGTAPPALPARPRHRRRLRRPLALAAVAGLAVGALAGGPPAAQAGPPPPPPPIAATITLTMDYFERFEVPDDGIDEEGEFMPEVFIGDPATGGGVGQRGGVVSDDHFIPKNLSGS